MRSIGIMLCLQNPTLTSLEFSPDLGSEKPVTNYLICDTANILYTGRDNYSGV
jgi:hypothetical protein